MARSDPRYVYRGGPLLTEFLDEWFAARDAMLAAVEGWNTAHAPDWRLDAKHSGHWSFAYSAPHDRHPEWYHSQWPEGETGHMIEKRMNPLRRALTKAGTVYQDKRGDIWRAKFASLPPAPDLEKRADAVGLAADFWKIPGDKEGRSYYGPPHPEKLDGGWWVTSMFEIELDGISPDALQPASLSDYYAAKGRDADARTEAPADF